MSAVVLWRRARETPDGGPMEVVRSLLEAPDDQLDYARAKLTLDAAVDPTLDVAAIGDELRRLADKAVGVAGAPARWYAATSRPTGDTAT